MLQLFFYMNSYVAVTILFFPVFPVVYSLSNNAAHGFNIPFSMFMFIICVSRPKGSMSLSFLVLLLSLSNFSSVFDSLVTN